MQTTNDLIAERKKDYRNILTTQFVVIVVYFTLKDVFSILGLNVLIEYINIFYLLAVATYFFLLWDLIRNFTENKFLIKATFVILIIDYALGILGENPFSPLIVNARPYYFFIHSTLMLIEWIAISYAIGDLFNENQNTTDKLWCSAALYLMIGISFGSMYDLINIIHPGSFGKDIHIGFPSYIEGIYYSMQIQGAGTPPYANASSLHASVAVLQAVWNNLYMVLLIGRILVLPEPKVR